jgi:hypothetical protein
MWVEQNGNNTIKLGEKVLMVANGVEYFPRG